MLFSIFVMSLQVVEGMSRPDAEQTLTAGEDYSNSEVYQMMDKLFPWHKLLSKFTRQPSTVLYIDNLSKNCSRDDLLSFVENLSVTVISCCKVTPGPTQQPFSLPDLLSD